MRIGILGTGVVGQTLGARLVQLGHDVKLGSRSATNEKAAEWAASAGEHATQFLCGNDADAKTRVTELLRSFGWRSVLDLGAITGSRGMEMILPIWLRLMGTLKTPMFNFHIARG
jgi:predicted dinucleotide-binding enzyme